MNTLKVVVCLLSLISYTEAAQPRKQPASRGKAVAVRKVPLNKVKAEDLESTASTPANQPAKATGKGWQKKEFIPLPGMSFHPVILNRDGTTMLVIGETAVQVFTEVNGKMSPQSPLQHGGLITGAMFSPQEKHIITSSNDKSIKIWDAQTRELVREEKTIAWMGQPIFSDDKKWMFSVGKSPDFKNAEPPVFYWRMEGDVPSKEYGFFNHGEIVTAVSMDTSTGVVTTTGKNMVKKWIPGNPQPIGGNPAPQDTFNRKVTSKGPRNPVTIVTYDRNPLPYVLSESGTIPFTMPKGVNLKEKTTQIAGLALSPTGDVVLVECTYRKMVKKTKNEKGGMFLTKELFAWKGHKKPPISLIEQRANGSTMELMSYQFLDATTLITTAFDGKFTVWDSRTLTPTQTLQFEGPEKHLSMFVLSPDGQNMAITVEKAGVLLLEKK